MEEKITKPTGNLKTIHIGKFIYQRFQECEIGIECAAAFVKVSEEEI